MRRGLPTEVKVGIFVIIMITGLVYLTTQINQSGFSFYPMNEYTIYFDNVSGLLPKTPAEIAGIRKGQVRAIELRGDRPAVIIELDEDVILYDDMEFKLETRGLLGEKIIMIEGGGSGKVIPPGGVIDSGASPKSFDKAVENFAEVAELIKDFLKGGEGKPSFNDIIGNATEVTEDIKQLVKAQRGDLSATISNIRTITDSMKGFFSSDDPEIKDLMGSFKETMARLDRTAASLERIVSKVEAGEGTIGKLMSDDETINKLNDAVDGVSEFVGQVKQLEIAVGYRTEYMSTAAEPVSVTTFRFRPGWDKYFLLEVTDGPLSFASRSKSETTIRTDPPGTEVTRTETGSDDSFLLTALFARRLHFMTLSAGIIRNTGGFAADFHFYKDIFDVGIQAFDFGRTENPRLRLQAKFNFYEMLFLNGGVDDLINGDKRRNYFLGAGFLLKDDDLKKLFGLTNFITP